MWIVIFSSFIYWENIHLLTTYITEIISISNHIFDYILLQCNTFNHIIFQIYVTLFEKEKITSKYKLTSTDTFLHNCIFHLQRRDKQCRYCLNLFFHYVFVEDMWWGKQIVSIGMGRGLTAQEHELLNLAASSAAIISENTGAQSRLINPKASVIGYDYM